MSKFRASYTILNTWASGDYERTVNYYFRLVDFKTPAMVAGNQWHDKWAAEIMATRKMPQVFGGKELTNPIVEQYKKVSIKDWLELSGKIDCLDGKTVYDWKTGKTSSESHASDKQVGIYGVLCTMSGVFVDRGEIHHYDQYKKLSDMSIIWITDKLLKESMEWIETLSSEIHNYFMQNDLYTKFGSRRDTTKLTSLEPNGSPVVAYGDTPSASGTVPPCPKTRSVN